MEKTISAVGEQVQVEEVEGGGGWNFRPNENASAGVRFTVRGVLHKITANLQGQKPTISLAIGDPSSFPSFRCSPAAQDALVDALCSSSFNSYTPSVGLLPARIAIAEHLSLDLPYELSPDDIFLTVGGTQAIELILNVLSRPGANVLLPTPGYLLYRACAALCSLQVREFHLDPHQNWEVDLASVEAAADHNTVAMVIINPGNPCGNVFSYQHLEKVAQMAKKLGILVIADEVYRHLAFGTNSYVPMGTFASIVPVITLGSLSKRWIVPGWRIGWISTHDPEGILKETKGALPQILGNTEKHFHKRIIDTLRQTAELLHDRIQEIDCITCLHKPEGAMCTMVKLETSLLEDILDDSDFCCKLASEESLVILPGSAVGFKNWLRITFAIEPSTLDEGLGRLKSFCRRHAREQ